LNRLKDELLEQVNKAKNVLYKELENNFEPIVRVVQTKRGALFVNIKMQKYVDEILQQGEIEEKEAQVFYSGKIFLEVVNSLFSILSNILNLF